MTRIYHLVLSSKREFGAYQLRSDIQSFLDKRGGCKVVSGGINCIDPSYTDLEVRFKSQATAHSSIADLRAAYSDRCDIEVSDPRRVGNKFPIRCHESARRDWKLKALSENDAWIKHCWNRPSHCPNVGSRRG